MASESISDISALMQQASIYGRAGNEIEEKKIYKKVLSIDPGHAHALNNMAFFAHRSGNLDEAIGYYKKAITTKPDFTGALNNLGILYLAQKKLDDARTCFQQALKYKPDYPDALFNLGNILREQGKYDEAMNCFLKLAALRPDGNAHASMGFLLDKQGHYQQAIAHYQRATELAPGNLENWNNLGNIYNRANEFEDALNCFEKVLANNSNQSAALSGSAAALKNMGKVDDAVKYYKRALQADSYEISHYSNILLAMLYSASFSPEEVAQTAFDFGRQIADPLLRNRPFIRNKDPERKLTIGYLSSDFYNHSAHHFFEFLPELHDRNKFEIYAYSNVAREDAVTERLKKNFDHWRTIALMDDESAADIIEKDEIDILIDMSGHAGNNRLLVFARKPAPIQASWLGYPATTGMKVMDYRITDIYAEPPGMTEDLNTENLCRLPEIFCCYQPHANSPAVINHPPFEENGYVTFGCFNNFSKVTDEVLKTWSKILAQVPKSKLLLEIAGIEGAEFKADVEHRISQAGISLDRVILEQRKKENQFVLYNKIDIALDPFPCNGGTTSMDALWMGVPLIALAGRHFVSRMGVTILTNVGLKELVAGDKSEYVKLAVDLASDQSRLKNIRQNLREKVAASPMMNREAFTRHLEDAYRHMWRDWCTKK